MAQQSCFWILDQTARYIHYWNTRLTKIRLLGSRFFLSNLSFHEHGKYDVTAMIDRILNITGLPSLLYIGYSMGTTSFFIMMSERPEYNSKVIAFVGLAPAVYLDNLKEFSLLTLKTMDTTVSKVLLYQFWADKYSTQSANGKDDSFELSLYTVEFCLSVDILGPVVLFRFFNSQVCKQCRSGIYKSA